MYEGPLPIAGVYEGPVSIAGVYEGPVPIAGVYEGPVEELCTMTGVRENGDGCTVMTSNSKNG